jgi:DNA helicase-2/ATP-dependent DNA helicase PcrA
MTVHSAKGLEFNVVFISGLEEGLFPHENSVNDTRNGGNGLEEERRLMYVAVTRARQRLYLSIAQSRMLHGQTRYNLPSRFLNDFSQYLPAQYHAICRRPAHGSSAGRQRVSHRHERTPRQIRSRCHRECGG